MTLDVGLYERAAANDSIQKHGRQLNTHTYIHTYIRTDCYFSPGTSCDRQRSFSYVCNRVSKINKTVLDAFLDASSRVIFRKKPRAAAAAAVVAVVIVDAWIAFGTNIALTTASDPGLIWDQEYGL